MYPLVFWIERMSLKCLHLFLCLCFISFGLTLLTVTASTGLGADTQLQRGQKLFKKCVHCHTYKRHQGHRIGPNLYGMFGRKAGAIPDYDYSEAWKDADFVWTNKTLDTYLMAPHKMIPNNRMPFDGLSRPNDRSALILYLREILTQ